MHDRYTDFSMARHSNDYRLGSFDRILVQLERKRLTSRELRGKRLIAGSITLSMSSLYLDERI
jgi:hypothetical protein